MHIGHLKYILYRRFAMLPFSSGQCPKLSRRHLGNNVKPECIVKNFGSTNVHPQIRCQASSAASATTKLPASHLESSKKALEQLKEAAVNRECISAQLASIRMTALLTHACFLLDSPAAAVLPRWPSGTVCCPNQRICAEMHSNTSRDCISCCQSRRFLIYLAPVAAAF